MDSPGIPIPCGCKASDISREFRLLQGQLSTQRSYLNRFKEVCLQKELSAIPVVKVLQHQVDNLEAAIQEILHRICLEAIRRHQPPGEADNVASQQQHQAQLAFPRPMQQPFEGLSKPLPSGGEKELSTLVDNLTFTKQSIEGVKSWLRRRFEFVPAFAEALKHKVFATDDLERQLPIVHLASDILYDSLRRRVNPPDLDDEALAFKPVLGPMLARIYHNSQIKEESVSPLQNILRFWDDVEIFDNDTIRALETEMVGGKPASFSVPPTEFLRTCTCTSAAADAGEKLPRYPLFSPRIVRKRKREIKFGTYSPMRPFNIPTVSEAEVNPSGTTKQSESHDNERLSCSTSQPSNGPGK